MTGPARGEKGSESSGSGVVLLNVSSCQHCLEGLVMEFLIQRVYIGPGESPSSQVPLTFLVSP